MKQKKYIENWKEIFKRTLRYLFNIMFMHVYEKSNNNNNDVNQDRHAELLRDLDLVSRFCVPICCRDIETRELALDVITKTVEGWLDGVGSPRHYRTIGSENRAGYVCADSVGNRVPDIPKEYIDLVTLHLPILLRLSLSCPFINVREKCQQILDIVKVSRLPKKDFFQLIIY